MKNRIFTLLLCACMMGACTSCSTPADSTADASSLISAQEPVNFNKEESSADVDEGTVMLAKSLADRNAAVKSLEELITESDIILRATAAEITHFITPETTRIMTSIQPENVSVIKGDYQGEMLVTPGGEMQFQDFYAQLGAIQRQMFSGTDENGKPVQTVVYQWEQAPIIRKGDDVVFFGEFTEDGTLQSTYFTQGTFLVKDGNISITEETIDTFLYDDFVALFGDSVSADELLAAAQ